VLNWLSSMFRRQPGLRPAPHIEAVARHNANLWPQLAEVESQARVYQQSPWVYIAINRIAGAAALVPLHVVRLEGERQIAVERHPLEDLLDAPNPYISRFELMEQTIGMLELTGNAYWFLASDGGVPAQIWPLRPDRISIVPDAANFVKGYIYEIDGLRIPLDVVEVVHFKRWHPANDYYGLSALESGRLAIQSDRSMAEWNRNTFGQDNGVPAGIVSVKDHVTDADFERIKRDWRQTYGGPQRRTAFLRGGQVEWHNIGLSHTDLDFLKGREAHRNEILNLFGIPVGLVSENATEANAKVAERLFVERTLWPKLVRLAQKITQEMLPFWPGEYIALFEDIRPTDVQARLDEIRTAYPVLSINEIRQRYYQLPAVDWGGLPAGMQDKHPIAEVHDAAPTSNSAEAADPAADGAKAALVELRRWERFTLKRWGQDDARAFEVRALSDDVAFEVALGLLAADSADEAQAVFRAARDEVLAG
jgi:HK97 family phage portal protein